jgi:transposase
MKAYSLDLRQRVLAAALRGDRTIPEVSALLGVSTYFVNKMLRLHRAGEDLAPRPHSGGHVPRLQARRHRLLRAAVAAGNDSTLGELRDHLRTRARVTVSVATVSRALSKLGLPRKKKHEGGGAVNLQIFY